MVIENLLSKEECIELAKKELQNHWPDYGDTKPEYHMRTFNGHEIFEAVYDRPNPKGIKDAVYVTIYRDTRKVISCITG